VAPVYCSVRVFLARSLGWVVEWWWGAGQGRRDVVNRQGRHARAKERGGLWMVGTYFRVSPSVKRRRRRAGRWTHMCMQQARTHASRQAGGDEWQRLVSLSLPHSPCAKGKAGSSSTEEKQNVGGGPWGCCLPCLPCLPSEEEEEWMCGTERTNERTGGVDWYFY
jgi:hypothetical protein